MAHRHLFNAVDKTFRDIMKDDSYFGNKLMVFGGDFRQVLPVVKNGNRDSIVKSSLKYTKFWKKVIQHKLTENMRIKSSVQNQAKNNSALIQFADYLLQLGEGKLPHLINSKYKDDIQLPRNISANIEEVELFHKVFYDIENNYKNEEFLTTRAILTPKNNEVDLINELASKIFLGLSYSKLSIDTVLSIKDVDRYPVEFLNTISAAGLPPHKLDLKKHQPIILLRNIDQEQGLCNGTRLIVIDCLKNLIKVKIANGANSERIFYIPRMGITPDLDLPFELRRLQFPVRSAFAMTINKAQGATLKYVGIYLPEPVFSHGQLYVAMSRVSAFENMFIATNQEIEGATRNVVYTEILK
jgi:hypothetical protein